MKKILALVLAAVMMMTMVAAFAAETNNPAADTEVTIIGLEENDDVSLYQVLEWDTTNNTGWKLTSDFTGLDVAGVNAIIANTGSTLTKADVEAITNFVKTNKPDATYNKKANSSGVFNTAVTAPGMFLALVSAAKDDTIYNPMIVSADYIDNETNEIDASNATLNGAQDVAIAKKDTVTLEKTHSDITFNAGDYVKFTVTTTIPAFADSYEPMFTITDTLSTGLELEIDAEATPVAHPFTVTSGTVTYQNTAVDGATTFTITFDSAKIEALTAPQAVTVEYWAKITSAAPYNVNEVDNTVEVEFSHNPSDDTDHGHKKDKTVEYLFDIDAAINGNSGYTTGEIVKVGVDETGNTIFESVTLSNQSVHQALEGAEFGIYTDADCTTLYTNDVFTTGKVTSDENGLLNIKGLKAGKYYIKELSAPDGFIKDKTVHNFEITYTTGKQSITETLEDDCVVSYEYDVLTGYTVKFDGGTESTYTWTNDGPQISSVTPGDSSSEIVNTKGVELPSTGGIGTTLFYLFGGIMVLAAGVVLVARRKAEE